MFEDIINFFRGKRNENRKYSPILIAVCALAIIVPTIFAIFYAYLYEEPDELTNNTIEIYLYDNSDSLIYSDKVSEFDILSSPLSNAFYEIILSKKAGAPSTLSPTEYNFKIDFIRKGQKEVYFCYFAHSADTSYIRSSDGLIFGLSEEYYNVFLNSEYSELAYSSSVPPTLTTGDGESVLPSSVEWSYQKQDLTFFKSSNYETSSEFITYRIGGAINLSFSVTPDECVCKLFDADGNSIFEGDLNKLSFVPMDTEKKVRMEISASWNNSDGKEFYGQTSYGFDVIVTDKAEFQINSSSVCAGGFAIVSIKNADAVSKIIYSPISSEDEKSLTFILNSIQDKNVSNSIRDLYAYNPIFVMDGDCARAIIPFPTALPSGRFDFSLSYGASHDKFSIEVTQAPQYANYILQKPTAETLPFLSDAAVVSLKDTLKGIAPPSRSMIVYSGSFIDPYDIGFSIGYTYLNDLIIPDQKNKFQPYGNEYLATSNGGQSIPAINVGTVVDVGSSDALGSYVAIEHGMGLRSWYCYLSDVNVQIGDTVAKGEFIGRCSNKGLVSQSGFVLLVSVYDVIIDPNFILGKEIIY